MTSYGFYSRVVKYNKTNERGFASGRVLLYETKHFVCLLYILLILSFVQFFFFFVLYLSYISIEKNNGKSKLISRIKLNYNIYILRFNASL